jgi:thioredoxin-related protein
MKRFILSIFAVISIAFANDINLDQLVVEAKKTNKHILVYLHITGCVYCVRMQEFTLDDDMVKAAIKKDFIFVDMNVKDEGLVQYDNFKVSKIKFAKESKWRTCI